METSLLPIVLAWMATLAPNHDSASLALAITQEAQSKGEAAALVATAFYESSFRADAVGDSGKSVCAFQIHRGSPDLLDDVAECTHMGATMLRHSAEVDPKHPFAWYVRGPRWQSETARKMSDLRVRLVKKLLATEDVHFLPEP
jgi:hypothetical protein